MVTKYRHVISKNRTPLRAIPGILHGHVFTPPSRAYYAFLEGWLDEGAMNQREAGKFFPLTDVDKVLDPYAKDDVPGGAPPPADGKIASAGQATGTQLDAPGTHWIKNPVRNGEFLDISWHFSASHKARRWKYFITKADWDPEQALSRDQFGSEPFFTVQNDYHPYWGDEAHQLYPVSPTTHQLQLPKREGYHVLLAVWEIADTDKAFYQVVDLDFGFDVPGERPPRPTGLEASAITASSVTLSWNAGSQNSDPIAFYQINRNGISWLRIEGANLSVVDTNLSADTIYNYAIVAIDTEGRESMPSSPIQVKTSAEEGENVPPYPPSGLHVMGAESKRIWLMWKPSTPGSYPIQSYAIYRDGNVVGTAGPGTEYEVDFWDTGLTPSTSYEYLVAAVDTQGHLSPPVAVTASTLPEDGEGLPEWRLDVRYYGENSPSHTPDKVIFEGKGYRCIQEHTSNISWSPKETADILWRLI